MTAVGRGPRVTDDELLDVLDAADDPVLSTAEIADALPIKRRGTLDRLRQLEAEGAVASKTVGGRNTVWWREDDVTSDESDAAASTPATHDGREHAPSAPPHAAERERPTPGGGESPTESDDAPETAVSGESEIDSDVWAVVDEVSAKWDDDDRLENRRQAAAEVLQHAIDAEEHVGKSNDAVQEARRNHPVAGQNEETYWRKNIRPVLEAVGDYSRGHYGYRVTDLAVVDS